MTVGVTFSTLETISEGLHTAALAIDETGNSSPGTVDAGAMTSLVSAMISGVTESAAGLSEGIEVASSEVLNSKSTYWNADEAARDGLRTNGGGR